MNPPRRKPRLSSCGALPISTDEAISELNIRLYDSGVAEQQVMFRYHEVHNRIDLAGFASRVANAVSIDMQGE